MSWKKDLKEDIVKSGKVDVLGEVLDLFPFISIHKRMCELGIRWGDSSGSTVPSCEKMRRKVEEMFINAKTSNFSSHSDGFSVWRLDDKCGVAYMYDDVSERRDLVYYSPEWYSSAQKEENSYFFVSSLELSDDKMKTSQPDIDRIMSELNFNKISNHLLSVRQNESDELDCEAENIRRICLKALILAKFESRVNKDNSYINILGCEARKALSSSGKYQGLSLAVRKDGCSASELLADLVDYPGLEMADQYAYSVGI